MKRIALLLLALTTIITTSHAQTEEEGTTKRCEAPTREHWNQGYASSFEQFPLYGNVEYLVANLYMIDEEGNEVHIDSEKFIFNENGDTLTWTAESNTEPNFRMELTYSAEGILIKEEIYRADKLEDTTLYEYSDDLAYRTAKVYDSNNEFDYEYEECYRNYTNEQKYSIENKIYKLHEINGVKVEVIYSTEYEEGRELHIYDEEERVVTIYTGLGSSYVKQYTYSYNEHGENVHTTHYTNNTLEEDHYYYYDKRGNVIEEIQRDDRGNILCRKRYKYDEHNNVTEIRIMPDINGYDTITKIDITYRN